MAVMPYNPSAWLRIILSLGFDWAQPRSRRIKNWLITVKSIKIN